MDHNLGAPGLRTDLPVFAVDGHFDTHVGVAITSPLSPIFLQKQPIQIPAEVLEACTCMGGQAQSEAEGLQSLFIAMVSGGPLMKF